MPVIDTIKVRRGTAAAWISANPVLATGELGLETDTGKIKYGDGSTAWTLLTAAVLPPNGTYVDTTTAQTAAGRKNFSGGIVVKGPRAINLQSYGVSPGGVINTALVSLLADAASTGAEAVIDPTRTSEYLWTLATSIVLPKTQGLRVAGVEKYGSLIKATAIPAGQPMVKWDTTVNGHVEDQTIENLALARTNTDGPVLQFAQSTPPPGDPAESDPRLGDRWKSRIINVQLQNITSGAAIVCDIPYILHGDLDRLWLMGSAGAGGIGLRLYNGSHAYVRKLYTPQKSNAPRTMLKADTGGSHTFIAPRAEGGGNGGHCYQFVNISSSTLIDPQTEGAGEDAIFLIDGCYDIEIISPGIGYPDSTASANPRGIKFVGSSGCRVRGGVVGDWSGLSGGKIIEFDSSSHENVVEDVVAIAGLTPMSQIVDAGKSNRVRILVKSTTAPPYQRQEHGYPRRGIKKPAKWYTSGGTIATGLIAAGRLFYVPFDIDSWTAIDRLGIGITTGGTAGALIRLGLYADDGTNWPGSLLLDAGTVDGATVAAANIVLSPSQSLSPGRYWRACVTQGAPATAPTVRTTATADATIGLFTQGDAFAAGLYQDSVTGALPATAAPTAVANPAPIVPFRAA